MSLQSTDAPEGGCDEPAGREVVDATSRPTPLALISDAVAGGDLQALATSVARILGRPVGVAIPHLGPPTLAPEPAAGARVMAAVADHARDAVRAGAPPSVTPAAVSDAVAVRIAGRTVGIVAAIAGPGGPEFTTRRPLPAAERRVWLEAAAVAASVIALIDEREEPGAASPVGQEIIAAITGGEPVELSALLTRASRAGVDLHGGAIALTAWRPAGAPPPQPIRPPDPPVLLAGPSAGRLQALVPLGEAGEPRIAGRLRAAGWSVALSRPRSDPQQLRDALRESEILAELHAVETLDPAQEETYRLLIGVLLRDPEALDQLRQQTVTALTQYDARHATELMETLRAFLRHDGSTTATAEALRLHRHTVGYRLGRVHEVSGLSPYETAGRERLGLGLKAAQLIASADRARERDTAR